MQAVSMQQPQCLGSPRTLPLGRSLRHLVSCRGNNTPSSNSMRGSTRLSTQYSSCRSPFLGVSPLGMSAGQSTPGIDRASRLLARAEQSPEIQDRIAGAVPYLIPLFDGLKYGEEINTFPLVLMKILRGAASFAPCICSICRSAMLSSSLKW